MHRYAYSTQDTALRPYSAPQKVTTPQIRTKLARSQKPISSMRVRMIIWPDVKPTELIMVTYLFPVQKHVLHQSMQAIWIGSST